VSGESWWIDEVLNFNEDKLGECDVLVTHSVPTWQNEKYIGRGVNFFEEWCKQDDTLAEECHIEKSNVDKLITLSKAREHYCGHMHHSSRRCGPDGVLSTILDIDELREHINEKQS
jgi:hypothetical protein